MRRRVYLIGVLAWIFAIPLAHADPPLQEQYLRIYLKINDAEHLEKQGDFPGALADFKDCYDSLVKIHQEDPNWESALVLHRMDDCKAKILDLQSKVDAMPAPTTVPASETATPTPTPSTNPAPPELVATPDMPEDVPSLKKRLQEVQDELTATKNNLKDTQAQVDTYRSRLETVNQQLQALKNNQSADDKVAKLLDENKALTDKLTAAQKQIDEFKLNPKSKLAQVQSQLKNLQEEFDNSQAANKSLQQTITTLQTHLDEVQNDLVIANQKLASAGPSNEEYTTIKRENEVMRGILQHELQEQARRDEAKRLAQEEFDNLKLKSKVLQEQLDILGSPMTPATTDEERALLANLKTSGADVTQPPEASNVLSASATPSPTPAPDTTVSIQTPTTNNAPAMDQGSTPATPDNSTNQPPVTVVSSNPSPTPSPDASTPAGQATDSTATNSLAQGAPPAGSATNAPDAATPPATPAATDSNAPTPTSVASTDAPTVSHLPEVTTTVTDTTITKGPPQQDTTQYSTKARLPDDMRDTAQEAADLFKNQRYDDAAGKYQSIIDKYPDSLYAWSNLGVVRFQQGDLPDALKALQQAVKLSPTDAFSYSNLGIVYYQMGQYENAIDALNSAKALDPNDAKTRNYLGCACSQKGWQEVAEKEFRKAIELDSTFGDAHFNLALVYATEKPPLIELARQEYKKALELGIAKDDRLEKLLQMPKESARAEP